MKREEELKLLRLKIEGSLENKQVSSNRANGEGTLIAARARGATSERAAGGVLHLSSESDDSARYNL